MSELIICCILSFAIGAIVTSVIWNIVMNKMLIKNLQGIEEHLMKEILILLIFALAVFAAILINEGGK